MSDQIVPPLVNTPPIINTNSSEPWKTNTEPIKPDRNLNASPKTRKLLRLSTSEDMLQQERKMWNDVRLDISASSKHTVEEAEIS